MKKAFTNSIKCLLPFALILLAASIGFSEEDLIILKHKQIGSHQRPVVRFPHAGHLEDIDFDCSRCHHEYDQDGAQKEGKGSHARNVMLERRQIPFLS